MTVGDLSSTLISIGTRQTSCLPRDYINSRLFMALAGWQIPLVFVKEDKGLGAYECTTLEPGFLFLR